MRLLPDRLARRSIAVVGAYLLLAVVAGALAPFMPDQAVGIGLTIWYGGAAGVFLVMTIGFSRSNTEWRLFAGLLVSAGTAAMAALLALVILVNFWEKAGLPH